MDRANHKFLGSLSHPDDVGTSEYRAVYAHVSSVIDSAKEDGLGFREIQRLVFVSLEEMEQNISYVKQLFAYK